MKKIITLVLVSVLGGIITLSAYKLFLENNNPRANVLMEDVPVVFPVNNYSNSSFIPENSIDFTMAAEKTIHTVVHVKNTRLNSSHVKISYAVFCLKKKKKKKKNINNT